MEENEEDKKKNQFTRLLCEHITVNNTRELSGGEEQDGREEKMIILSGQQTAARQIPITIYFTLGVWFKAFFSVTEIYIYAFWFRLTTQLPPP